MKKSSYQYTVRLAKDLHDDLLLIKKEYGTTTAGNALRVLIRKEARRIKKNENSR